MPSLAIVPAAGKGERFGGAKLVADVGGIPLLGRTLACLLEGGVDRIVVVLPPAGIFDAIGLLADSRVAVAVNPDPSRGMFSSIQTGFAAAEGDPILVLPGDMPFVATETVAAVLAASARLGGLVVPRHDGRRGHPIALAGHVRSAVLAAPPGTTLSELLRGLPIERHEIDVVDPGILRDVDVRGDLS
jgi:molybdenum cofactor cytidylyltransferase